MNTQSKGLVSVVTPTYRRAEKLKDAIDSVLAQTYKKIELLVVNDNEPNDEYSKELAKLISTYDDNRLHLINQKKHINGNVARNFGIKNAKGEYVAFLDDDDQWLEEKIELQMEEFNKNKDVGLVYTGAEIIYIDKNIVYNTNANKSGDLSQEILVSNCIGSTSSVMVKKNILNLSGYFDETLRAQQDYDLWIRICQQTKIGVVSKPLLKYFNFSSTNQISDDINKYIEAVKHINEKYSELYKLSGDSIRFKHRQSNIMFLANQSLRNGNSKQARVYLKQHWENKATMRALITYFLSFLNYDMMLKLRSLKK
ncbi:glycosyltransferase family 2 protein [Gracilibacillus phocaeensis]|uniref:glycosyltransferase family 2 protein n=1 Tax=Gracilibacillus phocaeensis TaxID=2042304 RepID=UPI00102F4678|nr:glycosyltransferase family A protein [Gracilibacillus phocaeensis]